MDIKALMEKRFLGIPVLYLALVFVGVLAFVAWRMKATPDDAEEETAEDESEEQEGDAPTTGQPIFTATPTPVYSTPETDSEGPSNEKWLREAITYIAKERIATFDAATVALQRYLNGEQLSVAEGRIRDAAIAKFGLPPDLPTSGGTATPSPTTPVPSTPPKPEPKKYVAPGYHTVSGTADNTYTKMAKLFYNRTDNASIDLIQSYNVSQGHEGPFKVGTRFWIPKYAAPKYIKATSTMRTAADIIKKNPPLNSTKMLQELNDGMKFPVKVGTRVRVA